MVLVIAVLFYCVRDIYAMFRITYTMCLCILYRSPYIGGSATPGLWLQPCDRTTYRWFGCRLCFTWLWWPFNYDSISLHFFGYFLRDYGEVFQKSWNTLLTYLMQEQILVKTFLLVYSDSVLWDKECVLKFYIKFCYSCA